MEEKLKELLDRLHQQALDVDSNNLEYYAGYIEAICAIKKAYGFKLTMIDIED